MNDIEFEQLLNKLKFENITSQESLLTDTFNLIKKKEKYKKLLIVIILLFLNISYITMSILIWFNLKINDDLIKVLVSLITTIVYSNFLLIIIYYLNIFKYLKNTFKGECIKCHLF